MGENWCGIGEPKGKPHRSRVISASFRLRKTLIGRLIEMKQKIRSLSVIGLALALGLAVVACGGSAAPAPAPAAPAAPMQPAAPQAPQAAAPAAAAPASMPTAPAVIAAPAAPAPAPAATTAPAPASVVEVVKATSAAAPAPQSSGGQAAQAQSPPSRKGGQPGATTFADYERTPFVYASDDRVSTFSLDTDRTSYHLALNWAREGYDVEPDSVRAEEWINAFNYG